MDSATLIYLFKHEFHYKKSTSSTTRLQTLTVACLKHTNVKQSNGRLKSRKVNRVERVFKTVHSVLKFTTVCLKKTPPTFLAVT